MKAPGQPAQLTYDTAAPIEPGDVLETSTGRRYLIVGGHRQKPISRQPDPECPDRWVLDTIVMAPDDPYPTGGEVHPLHWYRR